jgi:hypothetical protein
MGLIYKQVDEVQWLVNYLHDMHVLSIDCHCHSFGVR